MKYNAYRFARSFVLHLTSLAVAVLGNLPSAAAGSWVHGRGNVDFANSINELRAADPPEQLALTIATAELSNGQNGFFSKADLGNGELGGRAFIQSGNGAAGINPILGETITFNNTTGAESSWTFTVNLEGTVETGAEPIPVIQDFGELGPFRTTFIQFGIHVFPGRTVGPLGDPDAWNLQLGEALFSNVKNVDGFPDSGELLDFSASLKDSISGTLPLEPGISSFDFVLILAVQGDIPETVDSSFDFDFTDTSAASIESAVDFTSDSGVFLTGANRIPEPAAATLIFAATLTASLLALRRPARR